MDNSVQELQTLKGHTSDVTTCDFSSDCKFATGSSDKTVRIWEWKTGLGYVEVSFSPLREHKYGITYLSFSPQGTMLASCSRDGNTVLWSAKNGSKIHKFPQVSGDSVRVCKFTSDSCNLATGGDNGVVCIWDLRHRTLVRTIQQHEDTVQSLAFTIDSSFLLTTCTLGVMKLYAVSEICDTTIDDVNALISLDDAHDLGVLCCDFSNKIQLDEKSIQSCYLLATGGNDQCLKQWIIKAGSKEKGQGYISEISLFFDIKEAHSSAITCVRYNQQNTMMASASLDKTIKLWDMAGKCLHHLDTHDRYVNCVSFSRNGSMLCSGSNDKFIKIWDLTGGSLSVDAEMTAPCVLLSHFGSGDLKGISSVHEDNIMLLRGDFDDTEVIIKQKIERLHTAVVNSLEFGLDGSLATGSGDKSVRLMKQGADGMFAEVDHSPIGHHRYQVNNVTFVNPSLLASCSLDGNIALWKVKQNDNRSMHTLVKSSASVKCIRCNNHGHLMAAYDDGSSALWSLNPLFASPIVTYPEHAEAATSCACSPDGRLACSASHNGDFRIYEIPKDSNVAFNPEAVYVQDNAHDLGVQSIDFASHHNDLPLQVSDDVVCHLLATCGNDSCARIWKILIPRDGEIINRITCMEWRVLSGHGSSLTCIRFPQTRSDFVCTTSTDMQARIWSVYSGQCLHVLEHNALVASCSFSRNCELLATGTLEGQITFWTLPQQLVYDSDLVKLIRCNTKGINEWMSGDILQWLKETFQIENSPVLNKLLIRVHTNNLTGKQLLLCTENELFEMLQLDALSNDEVMKYVVDEIRWLRRPQSAQHELINTNNAPHQFLCPITHDIMRDPVKCSDGFTYERRAINEWFLSGGKYISPMTNQPLFNKEITPNKDLKKDIRKYIYENKSY